MSAAIVDKASVVLKCWQLIIKKLNSMGLTMEEH